LTVSRDVILTLTLSLRTDRARLRTIKEEVRGAEESFM
jgi:hypothetical protein